jgi:hypothetical protein
MEIPKIIRKSKKKRRYAHIPACLVLNKIDLVERRTDLLQLTDLLTEGLVDGQPPQTKALRMGILSCIVDQYMEKTKKKAGKTGGDETVKTPPPLELPLHQLHSVRAPPRDEQWHKLYKYVCILSGPWAYLFL